MTTPKTAPGAAATAPSTPSPTPTLSNAANAVSNRSGWGSWPSLPPDKVKLIHVAKGKVGMADEIYRAMLREVAGVDSSKQLDPAGFAAVMNRFKALGFVNPNNREAPPLDDEARRAGMATAAQRKYVRGLFRKWHGADNSKALRAWLQRTFHIADLRFATEVVARNAIEALKAMTARKAVTTTTTKE